MARRLTGFLVVPYAVRFDPGRGTGWFRDVWPLFWHLWSEHTDLMRHPLDRRLRELAFWWEHAAQAVPSPMLDTRAVQWWLARLLAARHWSWDRAFVAAHTGQPDDISERRRVPVVTGETALRPPLREFLFPPPFGSFLHHERWVELSQTSGDHVYIPPVTCYHARLTTLRDRPARLSTGADDDHDVPVTMRAIRLHQFRFGNGLLSLEFALGRTEDATPPDADRETGDDIADRSPEPYVERLHALAEQPRDLRVTFGTARAWPYPPVVHRNEQTEWPLRDLVADLLLPPRLYEAQDEPDRDQWQVLWADDPERSAAHRLELPVPDRLPLLVMEDVPDTTAARIQVDGLATTATALEPVAVAGTTAGDTPDGDPDSDSDADTDSDDKSDSATDTETDDEREERRRAAPVTVADTHRWTALSVFLLAVFRHVKTIEIADAVTSGRGNLLRSSARQLQALSVQLGHARDRFLGLAPVFGGWLARLWDRVDRVWGTTELQDRINRVVDSYRDGFFRSQSLRLVARVTSTFWFLFRWILLPLMAVQLVVIFGAAALFGVAGLLMLSLLTTLVILVARLTLWLGEDEGREEPPDDAAVSTDETETVILESRSSRWWRYLRRGLQLLAWSVPLVALIVVTWVWPQVAEHITGYLLWVGIPLLAGLVVLALVLRFIRKDRRERVMAHFRRDTFPILSLVLLGVAIYLAVVGIVLWIQHVGFDKFTLPGFWTDVAPEVAPDNLPAD